MTGYLIRRLLQSIAVVIGVSIIIFALLHNLPGGAARAQLGVRASPQAVAAFAHQQGYDQSIVFQYFDYLGRLVHGDLGFSFHNNQSVDSLIAQYLPKSIYLSGVSLVISLVIAIPLGIAQALRRNKPFDYLVTTGSFVGYSMPVFWLGLLLIAIFGIAWPLFPTEAPQTDSVFGAIADPRGMVLPVATLVIISVSSFSRFMRSSAIENLAQDYIRTARAKGLHERRVLFGHMLRNAMLPLVTLVGLSIPTLVGGNLITEQVFNYPGVGLLFFQSALARDYPVELALTLLGAVLVVIGNLVADVAYAIADPRVRLS